MDYFQKGLNADIVNRIFMRNWRKNNNIYLPENHFFIVLQCIAITVTFSITVTIIQLQVTYYTETMILLNLALTSFNL